MDVNVLFNVVAAAAAFVYAHFAVVHQGVGAALRVFPWEVYALVLMVLAIDAIDVWDFKVRMKRWPSLVEALTLFKNDVADKVVLSVAVAAFVAYYAATGDRVGAAKAVIIAGALANLAVSKAELATKLQRIANSIG